MTVRLTRPSAVEAPVWSDEADEILAGDLVAALAYGTPAGGAVLTPVCPLGLRDRTAGTVSFTTSTGFGRKLDRIAADPQIALAYHTRTHGRSDRPGHVLVQGDATVAELTPELLAVVAAQAEIHLGPPATGWFWDRWLRAYYLDRVVVQVRVRRITVDGSLPGEPAAQRPPGNGTAPRVNAVRTGRRVAGQPHRLLGYRGADGYPEVVPVDVAGADRTGLVLRPVRPLPPGGRRAGLLGHSFQPRVAGLAVEQHTGWLDVVAGDIRYAPHTARRFRLPRNRTVRLLISGLGARRARPAG